MKEPTTNPTHLLDQNAIMRVMFTIKAKKVLELKQAQTEL
jgi:hypothetical protein